MEKRICPITKRYCEDAFTGKDGFDIDCAYTIDTCPFINTHKIKLIFPYHYRNERHYNNGEDWYGAIVIAKDVENNITTKEFDLDMGYIPNIGSVWELKGWKFTSEHFTNINNKDGIFWIISDSLYKTIFQEDN